MKIIITIIITILLLLSAGGLVLMGAAITEYDNKPPLSVIWTDEMTSVNVGEIKTVEYFKGERPRDSATFIRTDLGYFPIKGIHIIISNDGVSILEHNKILYICFFTKPECLLALDDKVQ